MSGWVVQGGYGRKQTEMEPVEVPDIVGVRSSTGHGRRIEVAKGSFRIPAAHVSTGINDLKAAGREAETLVWNKGKPAKRRTLVAKSAPLTTSVSEDDARKLVARHGLKGPLPKNLDRNQRMAAYEARYVSAGGRKAEKWNHRANQANKVSNAAVGAATAAGSAYLAARTHRMQAWKPKLAARVAHQAELSGVGAATLGGAAQIYGDHAKHRRSSYASAPAGVAASALRRMRAYDPNGS
jgi:hypothetical protein